MMPRMRILLTLMIVLLPLRGWTGDAMAVVTMAAGTSTAVSGAHAHSQESATAHDCHGLDAADANGAGASPEPDQVHDVCAACALCQICHAVALTQPAADAAAFFATGAQPRSALPADLSATPLPGFKPPIA